MTQQVSVTSPLLMNVVSGKGGTGKSLLSAVLGRLLAQEGARVLLVDLDVFVRGLTYFFYTFRQERRVLTDGWVIADVLSVRHHGKDKEDHRSVGITRFFEVDLIPAVADIEEQLVFNVDEGQLERVTHFFEDLRRGKFGDFDYVIVDNRAGVDDLILHCSRHADLTLAVAESDPIARNTNSNLLRHLREGVARKIYTIINKVKFLRTARDYERAMEALRGDFEILGQIPFDLDLFEAFGTRAFWSSVSTTTYAFGLAEAWNKLAKREALSHHIDMSRFKRLRIWPGGHRVPTFLAQVERFSVIAGLVSILAYIFFQVAGSDNFDVNLILLLYGVGFLLVPLVRRTFRAPPPDERTSLGDT